jgi:hypothetical protein
MGTRHWPEDADEAVEELQELLSETRDIARVQTTANTKLRKKLGEVEKERDELKAHCERQHLALLSAIHSLHGGDTKADVRDVYDSVPHQNLAEIKAQAIEEATEALTQWSCMNTFAVTVDDIYEYTDKLREQSK